MSLRQRQFPITPEVLLMERFPQDIQWSVTQESEGLSAKVRGKERCFRDFRTAICWVAVQLGVPVT